MEPETLKHRCGVAGIYSKNPINVPHKLFYLLFSLQHRGQESSGVAYMNNDHIYCYKDLGLVSKVLSRYLSKSIASQLGIGHVGYTKYDGYKVENAQPLHVNCCKGEFSIAQNGAIVNCDAIRDSLYQKGAIFQTSTDTELILHLLSRSRQSSVKKAIIDILHHLKGAYSFVLTYNQKLIGIRDPNGYHPLYLGQTDDEETYVLASETCALSSVGIHRYREVEPGEIVIINDEKVESLFFAKNEKRQHCVFELIYFARPDSEVFGESVYNVRKKMGAALAKLDKGLQADMVISVPESGNIAAFGYAAEAGLPFEMGLTRNFYAGRSFILPTTEKREMTVRTKLNAGSFLLKDKRVVVVDDSLVRGTTSKIIIKILREAGAKEIHFRLPSPELHFPCYYGIDIPTTDELISNRFTPDEIAKQIGADTVKFLPLEAMQQTLQLPGDYCYACFNGSHLWKPASAKPASAKPALAKPAVSADPAPAAPAPSASEPDSD